MSGAASSSEPGGTSRRSDSCTGSTSCFEIVGADEPAQLQVVVQRRPGREGDERRPQRHAGAAHDRERARHVGGAVPLGQRVEHAVGQRLDGADDEQRAQPPRARGSARRARTMCSTLAVKLKVTSGCSACSARAMRSACFGPLRKSGSPKSMWRAPAAICARASSSTTSAGTAKKRPVVDGRNRTVPAEVLAAARRLDVARDAPFARDRQPRVLRRARAAPRRSGTSEAWRPRRRRLRRDRGTPPPATAPGRPAAARSRGRARCPPPRRAAPDSASRTGRRSRGARAGSRAARRAATRRPSTSAVCIGTEIATQRAPPSGARARRRPAVRPPGRGRSAGSRRRAGARPPTPRPPAGDRARSTRRRRRRRVRARPAFAPSYLAAGAT